MLGIAGASGAGKGSGLLWSPASRAIGPMIPAGLRPRVSMIDLKGGAETERGARDLFHRYATTMAAAIEVLTQVRDVDEGPAGAHESATRTPQARCPLTD